MAFEYGAQKLNIRNPFRFEGLIRSVRGLVLLVVGVYLLFQIQALLGTDKPQAWLNLFVGGLFVIGGLKALGAGLFQVMRFFVGRAAPASLSDNVAREAVPEREPTLYNPKNIHNMLMSKTNPTFVEPLGWFARAVHSVFPKLIVTPWPIRNLATNLAMKLTKSVVAIAAFLVASLVVVMVFAGTGGGDVGSAVVSLTFQLVLMIYLGMVWVKLGNPLARANMIQLHQYTSKSLAMVVIGAIVIPVLIAQGWIAIWEEMRPGSQQELMELVPLLEPVFRIGTLLTLTIVGAIVVTAISMLLIRARTGMVEVRTTSSEQNRSWRYDIHPRQIFTTLRDLVLMEKRKEELPNRIYMDKNDTADANRENEQFNGDLIAEIQPVVEEMSEPGVLRWSRITGTVLSQVMMLVGAFLFWAGADRALDHVMFWPILVDQGVTLQVALEQFFVPAGGTFAIVIAAFLLMGFGRSLAAICHVFWSEIFFRSNIFDFHCEGTVMRATHFRGADRHSASSEQDVFSFDATYFALATEAVSSTFAVSGQHNLEQPRYILSLDNCDGFMNSVVGGLEEEFHARNEEVRSEKRADREERLDYIRQEQEARRTGDLSAQGLVAPEQRDALESDLPNAGEREKITRWEGDSD